MKQSTIPRILIASGLAVGTVAVALMLPESIRSTEAQFVPPALTIDLTGTLRDFRRSHPDFDIVPSAGVGHYAKTVDMWLGDTPTLAPDGYKVTAQTTDSLGRNIAPYLANSRPPVVGGPTLGIRVTGDVEIMDDAVIDAYNAARGPYGIGGNYGATAYMSTNRTSPGAIDVDKKAIVKCNIDVGPMGDPDVVIGGEGYVAGTKGVLPEFYEIPFPSLPDPADMAPFVAKLDVVGAQTLTGDTDPDDDSEPPALHFGQIEFHDDSTLNVVGDLVIVCDGRFKMEKAELVLDPDASLTLYVSGDIEIKERNVFSIADATSGAVNIIAFGNHDLKIEKDTHIVANILAPERKLEMKEAHLYGGFTGREIKLDKRAGIHVDSSASAPGKFNYAITVREKLKLEEVNFDAFNSNAGGYGGANSGETALLITNTTKKDKVVVKKSALGTDVLVGPGGDPDEVIDEEDGGVVTGDAGSATSPASIPVVAAPLVGPDEGKLELVKTTQTISGQRRFEEIKLEEAILRISGKTTLRVDKKIELKKGSHIQLLPGATLTVYLGKDLKLDDNSTINAWGNPQRVSIMRTSVKSGKVEVKKDSVLAAWVQGAKTKMKVEDGAVFLGSFAGDKFEAKKATVYVDMADIVSCVTVNDTPGTRGASSTGGITSSGSFGQWYVDRMGVNVSRPHTITLTQAGGGVYEYIEPVFTPIDGKMFGDEGDAHNYFFTYEIDTQFGYTPCTDKWVEFRGGDGCWIFIDGQLVVDLGGAGATENQRIDIDRLGLGSGNHRLQLFYAQRRAVETPFELRTNLLLASKHVQPVSLQFD